MESLQYEIDKVNDELEQHEEENPSGMVGSVDKDPGCPNGSYHAAISTVCSSGIGWSKISEERPDHDDVVSSYIFGCLDGLVVLIESHLSNTDEAYNAIIGHIVGKYQKFHQSQKGREDTHEPTTA